MKNLETLAKVEDGVSVVKAYALFRKEALEIADLKVNLAYPEGRVVIHVAGSETEYTDLNRAKEYVRRVEESIVWSSQAVAS